MKRILTCTSIVVVVVVALVWSYKIQASSIHSGISWLDNFDDSTGLYSQLDTEVITATGHLALAHSATPGQYVNSGIATSVLINPLVTIIPSPTIFDRLSSGPNGSLYLTGNGRLFSYQLVSNIFEEISLSIGNSSLSVSTIGSDGLIYLGTEDYTGCPDHCEQGKAHLWAYNPNNGDLIDLGIPVANTISIHNLAAGPSTLLYGIAGIASDFYSTVPHLFSYDLATQKYTDFGLISPEKFFPSSQMALAVSATGQAYAGCVISNVGHLIVYDPVTGDITDKGQVLGQGAVNSLTVGSDGLIYGGTTNIYNGAMGLFFSYDPITDNFVTLPPYQLGGAVYAVTTGKDNFIYGGAMKNDWDAYLFRYDPVSGRYWDLGRIQAGSGHVVAVAWASNNLVYGLDTEGPTLVIYNPAYSEFGMWNMISFTSTVPSGSSVKIDVLDTTGNPLLTDVKNGDSLSSINPWSNKAIQLRAKLIGNGSSTPLIDSWSVNWADAPIAGLVGSSDSPTVLGDVTRLTSVTASGSNVTYTWNFGDGTIGTGLSVTHTYVAVGVYTAVVTATNSITVATATVPIVIFEGVKATVSPGISNTLAYTDSRGLTTTIQIPDDAITQVVSLTYSPAVTLTHPISPNLGFAGQVFSLDAYRNGVLQAGFTFSNPVTITLYYRETDVVGLDESQLMLCYWNGSTWTTDGIGVIERNTTSNYVVFSLSHLSEFALFEFKENILKSIFLPLVVKNP